MAPKIKILAWIYLVYGGGGLLAGSALCVGLLLSGDATDVKALRVVGPLFLMIAAISFAPAFAGGAGLLRGKAWARVVVVVLSVEVLLVFPVGTALGAFGLWALLGNESERAFGVEMPAPGSAPLRTPTPRAVSRYGGLALAMAAVAAGFVVVIGTGYRLSGAPAPAAISAGYYGAIVVLLVAAGFALHRFRSAPSARAAAYRLTGRRRRDRKALALARAKTAEERRRRLAELAADPARQQYAALIERGEAWSDAQIAYDRDPERLATCVHLQPIERAMRAGGIRMRYQTGLNVGAACCIDQAALHRRFALPDSVRYTEPVLNQRSYEDPPSAWIVCTACRSGIDAVHRLDATPETPVFPPPMAEQG